MNATKIILITLLTCLLSSCGLHLRSSHDIPLAFHRLHINTFSSNPLLPHLRATLNALQVRLVAHPQAAPYTLCLNHLKFIESRPSMITTTLAISVTYTLKLTIQILNCDGQPITPVKVLVIHRSIVQNTNQVYTPARTTLLKQAMYRDMISQIYYFLVTHVPKHHALRCNSIPSTQL